jgi:hypothetical protein
MTVVKLLIVSERAETAQGLSALLTAIGHEAHVTVVYGGDTSATVSIVSLLAPRAILLDAPRITPTAMLALRTLQDDVTTRWIPTVLLTDAGSRSSQHWINLQRTLDHRICMLPFHGAPNALYRLVGMLHGLSPKPSDLFGN